MTACRLIEHSPAPGAWNMAVDELLLDWAAAEAQLAWRFYGWNEPTVSLGYFQDYAQRRQHAASRFCPVVRRLTGGGTIVHDRELTYSVVVPAGHRLAADRDRLYDAVHSALIATLARWGVSASLCGAADADPHDEAFLCFQRRTAADVLVGGMKIAGSAQRRRRGAVLQHGSVILARSAAAPEIPGVLEVTGVEISPADLAPAWFERLAAAFDLVFQPAALTDAEQPRAVALSKCRYATAAWTERRE